MKTKIALIGELAMHVFVPASDGVDGFRDENPIQLGGNVGMIARQLHLLGRDFVSIGLVGNDNVGHWLRQVMNQIASKSFYVTDDSKTTSLVYIFYDKTVTRLRILARKPNPDLCLNQLDRIPSNSLVYCPYYPGYEKLAHTLVSNGHRVIFDFGHFSYTGNYEVIKAKLVESPIGFVAQINGTKLSPKKRLSLLNIGRERGFILGFITAGKEEAFGYDQSGIFSIIPPKNAVVCTVGAGDVTISEIISELAISGNFRLSCEKGCERATIKCSKWGIPKPE